MTFLVVLKLITCKVELARFLHCDIVQSLSHVRLFATPWTVAHQASLSFTISWSLLKLMSIESVMPSGGQGIGASASALVLPMNIQGWFPLGLTGLVLLLSKGLSRVFSSTTVWKHQFFGAQPFLWSTSHIRIWLLDLCRPSDVSAF